MSAVENGRPPVPAELKRMVLVEAGHRCAIPTCRETTTEIAHIVPWAKVQEHTFENLIALCPNCHTRFDQKGDIDRKAMLMYKHNLSLLNHRYGEFERRVFEHVAKTGERVIMVGAGGNLLMANAELDGIVEDKKVDGMSMQINGSDGYSKSFPMDFTFYVTDKGMEFIRRYRSGQGLD